MTFAQLFVTPLGAIGESLSQFFAGTMLHVPFILWPVIIVIILFVVVLLILMYSKYEVHLPFMMGSLRPSPHAAVTRTTNIVEQPANDVQKLQNEIEDLKLQLQEKNLQIEHKPNISALAENELRQRTTSPDIGFIKDVLPE